jgi:acyl-CoA synthetase (AMP-forming)/AMP-acid ligase II
MIISGGLNIYACDIEAAIDAHPAVRESAVIAVPDARWGEQPFAIVVLHEGQSASEDALLGWLEGRLARTSRPSGIAFVEALPRNDMGKVLKRVLREPFWRDRATSVA